MEALQMSGEPRPVSTPRHHLDPQPDPSGWKKSSEYCIIVNVENENSKGGFAGLRVLSLESRRAPEMAKLIASNGGKATVAPSMREIPLASNAEALAFAHTLSEGGFDIAIFLTGVGTRALTRVVETVYPVERFVTALRKLTIVARGPKPEDVGPLRAAVAAIASDEFDVVLFTTAIQVNHLFQVAAEMNQEKAVRSALSHMLIASIGPSTSERLREFGLTADIEPSHPKMGFLVNETAQRSAEILRQKRNPVK